MNGTRLGIDASAILPGHCAGIEAFTYGLTNGLAAIGAGPLTVTVPNGCVDAWTEQVPHPDVSWHESVMRLRADGPVGSRLRRWVPESVRSSRSGRLLVNSIRAAQPDTTRPPRDVTLFPFHGAPISTDPAVLVLHDLWAFRDRWRSAGYRAVVRANVARAAAVVVSWPYPYRQACELFPWAAPKMVLIPPPPFHPRPSGAVQRPERGMLLYPSSTAPHKNHSTLLEAMAWLPEHQLVCPGPLVPPESGRLLARTGRSDLRGRVSLPGFVSTAELTRLYARADTVVVPSRWEATSGAIFEAFSWGVPVACADVPPLRAQVQFAGGEVAFFDPDDPRAIARAVRKIGADRGRYVDASVRAGGRLAGRTWMDTADDYAQVMHWVAGGRRGPIPRSRFAARLADLSGGRSRR
ncbi:MAG TPA: glycosyltransferase [Actinoplanes sp.]|nr:glycosyltransferase [Actinoplanes sp.]